MALNQRVGLLLSRWLGRAGLRGLSSTSCHETSRPRLQGGRMFVSDESVRPSLLRGAPRSIRTFASAPAAASVASSDWQAKLVIFDKDGTLLHFSGTWMPWIADLVHNLELATGIELAADLYECLGICRLTQRPRTGVFGQGTMAQIQNEVLQLLEEQGVKNPKEILEQSWPECDTSNPETIRELAEMRVIFEQLRQEKIKIAICTSDTRKHTLSALANLQLLKYVDHLVCGDDPGVKPKPDPGNVEVICRSAGVSPKDVVVIGDSEADVKMARAAGVGLNIGVLSGIGTRLELAHYADYVADDVYESLAIVGRVQKQPEDLPRVRRVQTETSNEADIAGSKASLVIFDKDGTLICFHSMWTPWAKSLINRLETATNLKLYESIMNELGYCSETNRWQPGLWAEGTGAQNKEKVCEVLESKGLSKDQARIVLERAWADGDHSATSSHLKIFDNPTAIFKLLQENGVKVAICTSDARKGTVEFIESIGATDYVDMVVCGDDPGTEPKPSPKNAFTICRELNVHPCNAVIVGDTNADVGMGHSAKLGASVAVLSGVGRVKDFIGKADHVVHSIKDLVGLIFPKSHPVLQKRDASSNSQPQK